MQDEHGLRLYQGTSERWPPDVFSSLLGSTTQHQHLGLQDLFVRSQTPKHSLTISSFGNPDLGVSFAASMLLPNDQSGGSQSWKTHQIEYWRCGGV